jgi:hypothetical protein
MQRDGFELIVVDNKPEIKVPKTNVGTDARTDVCDVFLRPVEMATGEKRYLLYLPQETNIGFVAGNNLGIRLARGKYISLISDDVEVPSCFLSSLARTLEFDHKIAAVGPRCESPNHYQGRVDKGIVHYLATKPNLEGQAVGYPWLSFFCVMFRREALEDVGLLDERFSPGFCEDDDWCARAAMKGWQLAIDGRVTVKHVGRGTWTPEDAAANQEKNISLLREKWTPLLSS